MEVFTHVGAQTPPAARAHPREACLRALCPRRGISSRFNLLPKLL
jgi:hypothetical protein